MSDTTAPRVEQIDPTQAIIGSNLRLDPRLDKDFLASIRQHGVLSPVVATLDEEGRHVIQWGQRRTIAAVQTGRATIPAYIVADMGDADRIIRQLIENDHRVAITTGERVAALATLSGLGLTAAQIAKQTVTKRADVDAALTVAGSQIAAKAAERFDFLTLDQAATIAEFEGDVEAVKALTVAAKQGQFGHVAQELRNEREQAARKAEAAEALTSEGIPILEQWDPYGAHTKAQALRRLCEPTGGKRNALTVEQHKDCPGHAAHIRTSWTRDEHDQRVATAEAVYVCTEWRKHGHTDVHDRPNTKPARDQMTDAQREQAKAERRDVIDSNKAWDAAEQVRREWIKDFLTRKTAPKGSAHLIAQGIATSWSTSAQVDHARVSELARVFGVEATADAITKGTEGRALVLALGRVLAGYEAQTGRGSWRAMRAHTALYLKFLAANGYELADVEKRAAGVSRRPKKVA